MAGIKNIIFDFGGVLIDWNPMYVYTDVFDSEEKARWFIDNITTLEWNEEQDGGRLIADGERMLIEKHPEWEKEIKIYFNRWGEMLKGPISGTVEILREIYIEAEYKLLGLTNWSAETFPVALERYDFLQLFEGILVSGQDKLKKPDPQIYQLLMDRYEIVAGESLFIDDNKRNIDAAQAMGIQCIHFISPEDLRSKLEKLGILESV